jgi:chitin disaccharide deacetylase
VVRLIVNADDLGLTSGVNRAIFEAHRAGMVTSATLMANAPAFDEAVAAVLASSEYRARKLSIGCHIVLIDGVALSPPEQIRTLLDANSESYRFRRKLWKFALAAMFGGIAVEEVEREATAQIRKLQTAGLHVSHVDCHKHTHMFPPVLEGVLAAARTCGINVVRNPFEPDFARNVPNSDRIRSRETGLLHWLWHKRFLESVKQGGFRTTDGSLGVTATGSLDKRAFSQILRALPAHGTYEFVCHPGYNDPDLAAAGTRLLHSRETELSVLCSKEARDDLQASGAELITFWDLVAAAESNRAAPHPMP